MGTTIRCFESVDCSSDELSETTTQSSSSLNECCVTETGGVYSLHIDANTRSFQLDNGECRPCDRECCS